LARTLDGIIYNYNELRQDPILEFNKNDMIVFLICDGYDNIKDDFKAYMSKHHLFDFDGISNSGFMQENKSTDEKGNPVSKWSMRDMKDLVDENVSTEKIPKNILHMFQI
jgi:hypothetical protein